MSNPNAMHTRQKGVSVAPTSDGRNNKVSVFDHEGVEHTFTVTNARELVKHRGWTMDPKIAATRRVEPVEVPVVVNDGSPVAEVKEAPKPVAITFEDLTAITKSDLRAASQFLGITEIDGRQSERRIVALMDAALDKRLSESGDFAGAEGLPADASAEAIAENQNAAVARRRRAYAAEAKKAGLHMDETTTLVALVKSIAALVETPPVN